MLEICFPHAPAGHFNQGASSHPVFKSQARDAFEVARVAGDEGQVFGQGVGGDLRVHLADGPSHALQLHFQRAIDIDLLLEQLPTLPWTQAAADVYGPLKMQLQSIGRPIGEMDTQIAAHALAEDLTLVTHNTRHFERIPGLRLEDWMA